MVSSSLRFLIDLKVGAGLSAGENERGFDERGPVVRARVLYPDKN